MAHPRLGASPGTCDPRRQGSLKHGGAQRATEGEAGRRSKGPNKNRCCKRVSPCFGHLLFAIWRDLVHIHEGRRSTRAQHYAARCTNAARDDLTLEVCVTPHTFCISSVCLRAPPCFNCLSDSAKTVHSENGGTQEPTPEPRFPLPQYPSVCTTASAIRFASGR